MSISYNTVVKNKIKASMDRLRTRPSFSCNSSEQPIAFSSIEVYEFDLDGGPWFEDYTRRMMTKESSQHIKDSVASRNL
jgi:hypothetical protein